MSLKSAGVLHNLIFRETDPNRQLVITPLLEPGEQLHPGSASVDLRLGTRFTASRKGLLSHVDTAKEGFESEVANVQESYYVGIGEQFVLHPGHFVLGITLEYLRLPPNLAGSVVTRSSWGRHGLIIATAVAIHPKFMGRLTLELRNLAEVPLILYPGRRILQVLFYEVETTKAEQDNAAAFDHSQYLASTEPTVGHFSSEPEKHEIELIRKFPKY